MSVSTFVEFRDGRYVPFMQDVRGGKDGKSPVGTVHSTAAEVGEAGGGTVTISHRMQREQFGFRSLIVPTLIVASDNLSTAEAIRLSYLTAGNRRVAQDSNQIKLAVAGQAGNFAQFEPAGILLESDVLADTSVLQFIWSTNTDTKLYFTRVFAAVFDAELIEAQGAISDFLAGVR